MYSPARVPASSATSVKGGREREGKEREREKNESNKEEEEKEEEEEEEEGIGSRFERTKLGSSTMVRSRALAGSGAR